MIFLLAVLLSLCSFALSATYTGNDGIYVRKYDFLEEEDCMFRERREISSDFDHFWMRKNVCIKKGDGFYTKISIHKSNVTYVDRCNQGCLTCEIEMKDVDIESLECAYYGNGDIGVWFYVGFDIIKEELKPTNRYEIGEYFYDNSNCNKVLAARVVQLTCYNRQHRFCNSSRIFNSITYDYNDCYSSYDSLSNIEYKSTSTCMEVDNDYTNDPITSYMNIVCEDINDPVYTCDGKIERDPNACNGNGKCIAHETCQCEDGFLDDQHCYYYLCDNIIYFLGLACSSNGICVGPNICLCADGYHDVSKNGTCVPVAEDFIYSTVSIESYSPNVSPSQFLQTNMCSLSGLTTSHTTYLGVCVGGSKMEYKDGVIYQLWNCNQDCSSCSRLNVFNKNECELQSSSYAVAKVNAVSSPLTVDESLEIDHDIFMLPVIQIFNEMNCEMDELIGYYHVTSGESCRHGNVIQCEDDYLLRSYFFDDKCSIDEFYGELEFNSSCLPSSSISYMYECPLSLPDYFYCNGTRSDVKVAVCNQRGECVDNDVCECFEGYNGLFCEFPVCNGISSASSSVCNGFGTCIEANVCLCEKGFSNDNGKCVDENEIAPRGNVVNYYLDESCLQDPVMSMWKRSDICIIFNENFSYLEYIYNNNKYQKIWNGMNPKCNKDEAGFFVHTYTTHESNDCFYISDLNLYIQTSFNVELPNVNVNEIEDGSMLHILYMDEPTCKYKSSEIINSVYTIKNDYCFSSTSGTIKFKCNSIQKKVPDELIFLQHIETIETVSIFEVYPSYDVCEIGYEKFSSRNFLLPDTCDTISLDPFVFQYSKTYCKPSKKIDCICFNGECNKNGICLCHSWRYFGNDCGGDFIVIIVSVLGSISLALGVLCFITCVVIFILLFICISKIQKIKKKKIVKNDLELIQNSKKSEEKIEKKKLILNQNKKKDLKVTIDLHKLKEEKDLNNNNNITNLKEKKADEEINGKEKKVKKVEQKVENSLKEN